MKKGGRSFYGHSLALLIEGTTYTAKSAAADVAPPSGSPSSNF